jgi:flagellar biosynthesis regulator FlbT
MPLKVTVKSFGTIRIGTSKITVRSDGNTMIEIEGTLPVLRDGDYVDIPADADAAMRFYALIQDAYLKDNFDARQSEYQRCSVELLAHRPETGAQLEAVDRWLRAGNVYKALKASGPLIGLHPMGRNAVES